MIAIVCLVSQSAKEVSLSFDQYLAEKIPHQLEHFHSDGKVLNYQTLLLLMIIKENLNELSQKILTCLKGMQLCLSLPLQVQSSLHCIN